MKHEVVRITENPLKQAILFAGMGNAIDYGADPDFSFGEQKAIDYNVQSHIFDFSMFKEHLEKADSVLYLADNAGETIFGY
jgi:uncharacterized protein with ATP-grasp and redox domains